MPEERCDASRDDQAGKRFVLDDDRVQLVLYRLKAAIIELGVIPDLLPDGTQRVSHHRSLS